MPETQIARKKLIQRGRYTVLPIIGDSVPELCLRASEWPTIIFRDAVGGESQLTFGEALLVAGRAETRLDPSYKRADFDPQQFRPLLGLLGTHVSDAWAQHDGSLELTFSSGVVLPEGGYEGWISSIHAQGGLSVAT